MARIQGGTFRTVEELGQSIIDQLPGLAGRDPEEIGESALSNPKYSGVFIHAPQDFSEIDLSTAAKRAPGDFLDTGLESAEGVLELAKHPIDTGVAMAKLAGSGAMEITDRLNPMRVAQNPLLGLISRMNISEEDREGAREFGREVKKSVSPEGIQERPALALSNVLMAVPGGAGARLPAAAGRFSRALSSFKNIRRLADPAELPLTLLGEGAKLAAKPQVVAALKKAAQGSVEFAQALRSLDSPLRMDLFAGMFGFTTGKGPRFIRNMIERGRPDESFQRDAVIRDKTGRADPGIEQITETGADVQREFRRMPEDEAETIILTRALEAVDRFSEGVGAAYAEGLSQLPLNEPMAIDLATRRSAQKILGDMNVRVEGAERLDVRDMPIEAIPEQRTTLPSGVFEGGQKQTRRRVSTGEAEVSFPDFGDEFGRTTPIPGIGGGRQMVEETFLRIINAPEQVSVEDMINFRRSIGAALTTMSADIAGPAKVELTRLQDLIRKRLNKEVEGYREVMKDYEDGQIALEDFQRELGLEPGHITADGQIRGLDKSTTIGKLFRSLAENAGETKVSTLRNLESVGRDPSLVPAIVGSESRPLVGGGLVVKSEASQIGRAFIGLATLGTAAFSKIAAAPAVLVFSPRAVNEIVLRLLSPESKVMARAERAGARVKSAKAKTIAATSKVTNLVRRLQKANESSGGDLARLAKQGLSIGQLLERLQISTGVEFEEGDLAKSPKASTFMKTIGGIGRTPPAG
jgi:hypothetical protein